MKREEYLGKLTEQVRCKMARGAIEQEINDHIEDQKAEFLSEGMSQQEAEEAAVREMGDPVEVGLEMDRIHRPTMAWGMIGLIIGLSLAGYILRGIMSRTVSGLEADVWTDAVTSWHTSMELPMILFGIVLMIGVCYMDYTRIACYAKKILIAYYILIFIGAQLFGRVVNGSTRWIVVGGFFSVNMIDLLWVTIPLYAALLYQYKGQGYSVLAKTVVWLIFPYYFLVIRSQSITAFMILGLVYAVVLAMAVYKGWFQVRKRIVLFGIGAVVLLLPALLLGGLWLFGAAYQKARIGAIFSLGRYPAGDTQIAIVRKMLTGSSALGGNPEFTELVASMDGSVHLLVSVGAAYGVLAGALLAMLLLFLVLRFTRISLKQKNQLGMLMGMGCAILFLIQTVIFLGENLGILGNVGIYCPFFGTGRSGMLVTYLLLGLLLSICRYEKTAPEPKLVSNRRGAYFL